LVPGGVHTHADDLHDAVVSLLNPKVELTIVSTSSGEVSG